MYFTYSQSKNQQHSNRKQTSNTLDKLMQFLKATSTTALHVICGILLERFLLFFD